MTVYPYLISDTDGCIELYVFERMADAKVRLHYDVAMRLQTEQNNGHDARVLEMEDEPAYAYTHVRIPYSNDPDYAVYFSVTEQSVK